MSARLTPEAVAAAAEMAGLEIGEDELGPVMERLLLLLDATAQFAHLAEPTAEVDLRFNPGWEVEQS